MPNHFSHNIKVLRRRMGKSQKKVSDEMLILHPTYGAYEEGRAKPKLDCLIRIAEYYKISIDKLLKEKL